MAAKVSMLCKRATPRRQSLRLAAPEWSGLQGHEPLSLRHGPLDRPQLIVAIGTQNVSRPTSAVQRQERAGCAT
jgi:hypothetical protein